MKTYQKEITFKPRKRGFHLLTDEILRSIDISSFSVGIATIFIKHTSASLSINENADRSVRDDMETFFSDTCDHKKYYTHTYEGDDDMPSHIKSTLIGSSLTIPITNGRFNLGTWQGIYLNEHRDCAGMRTLVVTVIGD
jgi:secondary thiamine-phosphate synthase enzyme